jgi:hypothetical protein
MPSPKFCLRALMAAVVFVSRGAGESHRKKFGDIACGSSPNKKPRQLPDGVHHFIVMEWLTPSTNVRTCSHRHHQSLS